MQISRNKILISYPSSHINLLISHINVFSVQQKKEAIPHPNLLYFIVIINSFIYRLYVGDLLYYMLVVHEAYKECYIVYLSGPFIYFLLIFREFSNLQICALF